MAGLASGNALEPSLVSQRELLLDVALEYNMVGLIVAAVRDWADGKYTKAGCTLRYMSDLCNFKRSSSAGNSFFRSLLLFTGRAYKRWGFGKIEAFNVSQALYNRKTLFQ